MAINYEAEEFFNSPSKPKRRCEYKSLGYDSYSDIRIEIGNLSFWLMFCLNEIIKSI